jgi:hypothetical protein
MTTRDKVVLKYVRQQNSDGGVWPSNWANKEAWLLDNPHTSKVEALQDEDTFSISTHFMLLT